MRVLALNPYAAGSHRAFFAGWAMFSRHEWTLVELPGWNWKWRMRHGAIELADYVAGMMAEGRGGWDVIVCTDMMNAAEWRGLAPEPLGRLPLVVYFHENQAGYPAGAGGTDPRDVHFVLTNMVSALAAEEAWFNSAHNLETLLEGLRAGLSPAPGVEEAELCARVSRRARVEPPGIDDELFGLRRPPRPPGPLRVLWAARWEFDKRPEVFAGAMELLAERGVEFVVDVLGGDRANDRGDAGAEKRGGKGAAGIMHGLRERLGPRAGRFGWVESHRGFVRALKEADVVVSTAAHEFFGLAVVEAVAAGSMALVPRGLAYPEVLGEGPWVVYHDGSVEGVARAVEEMSERLGASGHVGPGAGAGRARVERYRWSTRAVAMDDGLERVMPGRG